jgi:hypothetical protein
MINAADVRSFEALQDLHAQVCKFRLAAQDSLAAVDLTLRRANDFIQEKIQFWQRAIRTCEEEAFQAKQELNMRKFPGFDDRPPDTTVQEENLKKAQMRLRHATEKHEIARRWMAKFPTMVSEVYDGPSKQLAAILEAELPRGIALLERRVQSLEAYAALEPPPGAMKEETPPVAPELEKKP